MRVPRQQLTNRQAVIRRLAGRDGFRCWYCHCDFDDQRWDRRVVIEHATASFREGTNRIQNLRLACRACDREKGADSEAEFVRRAWLLERRAYFDGGGWSQAWKNRNQGPHPVTPDGICQWRVVLPCGWSPRG